MKTVLANDLVISTWANQSQSEARNANSSIRFDGPCLFSYKRLIAWFSIEHENTVCFLTTGRSSRTTNRHISLAKYAVTRKGYTVLEVAGTVEQNQIAA